MTNFHARSKTRGRTVASPKILFSTTKAYLYRDIEPAYSFVNGDRS